MAFLWNGSAGEYAINDKTFLMSVDHDIGKDNGLDQWFSNVINYILYWIEIQKNTLEKKKVGFITMHFFVMEMRIGHWSFINSHENRKAYVQK